MRYSTLFRALPLALPLLVARLAQAQSPTTPFIGINTTAPTQALDINGNLRIRTQAGPGTRMVVALPDGTLGVQPVPVASSPDNLGNHLATQTLALDDHEIRLRAAYDDHHGLGWYLNWQGQFVDGPVLFGNANGALATTRSGVNKVVLSWNELGRVGIGLDGVGPQTTLDVGGNTRTVSLQVTTGAAPGKVLTADAAGNATWQALPAPADPSPTNELQTLGLTGLQLSLSNNGGTVTLPAPDNLGSHTATQPLIMAGQPIRLRDAIDTRNGLSYYNNLNSRSLNGPVLFGDEGGALATAQGGTMLPVITWANNGRVGIGLNGNNPNATLHVGGTAQVDALAGTGTRVVLANDAGRVSTSTASATGLERLLGMTSGTYFVGPDADGVYFSPIIPFGTTYATTPVVVCTVQGIRALHQPLPNDTFTVSVRDCGMTGFQVAVARIGGGGWGQDVQINWIAVP